MDLALLMIISTAALATLLFVTVYAVLAPWWRSPYGRSIMATKLAVLAVACGGIARRTEHELVASIILATAWSAVAVVMIWRLSMLWRDLRPNHPHKED